MNLLAAVLLVTTVDVAALQDTASWEAGPTKFTAMSEEERAAYLLPEAPQQPSLDGQILTFSMESNPDLPAAFTWADYDGANWMSPIRDQGDCGACWAFGSVAAVEAAYRISLDDPDYPIDLSEQFYVSCIPGGCGGGAIEPIMLQLEGLGAPDEACFPYVGSEVPCDNRCADWKSRTHTIATWRWILGGGEERVKLYLQKGPIASSMVIYSDFWAYRGGVYEHVSGASEGYHVVTIVGWDDGNQSWLARNSWGEDWGQDGYFEIRRGEAGLGMYGVQPYVKVEDVPSVDDYPVPGCACGMVW